MTFILVALNYDLDAPCVIQWSSPSRLNQTFTNNGTNTAKYHETVNMASGATVAMPFEGLHTPRKCLLRSVSVVLYRSLDKRLRRGRGDEGLGIGEMAVSAFLRQ